MGRERIAGLLEESKRSLEAEHGALRSELESGIESVRKKALS